jgi:AAA+ ATPase superfamily predicted ATPase
MNAAKNPFSPGAGKKPEYLAGREKELENGEVMLARLLAGRSTRPILFYGLRGVGKTVLLNRLYFAANKMGIATTYSEVTENVDFRAMIFEAARQALFKINTLEKIRSTAIRILSVFKSFNLGPVTAELDVEKLHGVADSGDFARDLVDLFSELGQVAQQENKHLLFVIDELQYLKEADFGALIATMHRVGQLDLPIGFICAGLPQVAALAGDAKSYAERLFDFVNLGALSQEASVQAITNPILLEQETILPEAVQAIYSITKGYPYFIQEFGSSIWLEAKHSPITVEDFEKAKPAALKELDNGFFKVRFERSTEEEKRFMYAMAQLGDGPIAIQDLVKQLQKTPQHVNNYRTSLIRKGFIFSPSFGLVDFTSPLFADFLNRYYGSV